MLLELLGVLRSLRHPQITVVDLPFSGVANYKRKTAVAAVTSWCTLRKQLYQLWLSRSGRQTARGLADRRISAYGNLGGVLVKPCDDRLVGHFAGLNAAATIEGLNKKHLALAGELGMLWRA